MTNDKYYQSFRRVSGHHKSKTKSQINTVKNSHANAGTDRRENVQAFPNNTRNQYEILDFYHKPQILEKVGVRTQSPLVLNVVFKI